MVTRFAAVDKTPALRDRLARRGFRVAAFFLPDVRDADFLLAPFFVEDFFFAAPVARRRPPAFRAVDRLRLAARFLPLLELRRDDFLAAAMIQLRGKNVPMDDSAALYSNFRAQILDY